VVVEVKPPNPKLGGAAAAAPMSIPLISEPLAGAEVKEIEVPLSSWPCGWDSSMGAAEAGTGAAGAGVEVKGIEVPLSSWPCGWDSSTGAADAGTGAAGAGAEPPSTLVDEDMPLEDEETPPKSMPPVLGASTGDGDIGGI